jgi:hypothetical protein
MFSSFSFLKRSNRLQTLTIGPNVGFWFNQIPLRLKLRKDRKTKILLLLKLGNKVCRMITETIKYYFTSNLSEGLKLYVG